MAFCLEVCAGENVFPAEADPQKSIPVWSNNRPYYPRAASA